MIAPVFVLSLVVPPERPAIVRAVDLRGLPGWHDIDRRDRALREGAFPFPVFCPASKKQQTVAFSGGTLFGNGTGGGGNVAAIDGNTNQIKTACAVTPTNATLLYLGYTFPAGHVWTGFKAWGANNNGFVENENNSTTINCRATNGSAPTDTTTAQSNGTLLGSVTFTDTADATPQQNLAMVNSTAYTTVWLTFPAAVGANTTQAAEILFYETV